MIRRVGHNLGDQRSATKISNWNAKTHVLYIFREDSSIANYTQAADCFFLITNKIKVILSRIMSVLDQAGKREKNSTVHMFTQLYSNILQFISSSISNIKTFVPLFSI